MIPLSTPIKIRYKTAPGLLWYLWPLVEVVLSRGLSVLPNRIMVLIDSGASNSVLRPEVAIGLGFDLDRGQKVAGRGVGAGYTGVLLPERVDVNIYDHTFDFQFTVIENMVWDCILGEDTIFEVARLDFQKFKGYFEIRFRQDIN